jgi:hypothetical protein
MARDPTVSGKNESLVKPFDDFATSDRSQTIIVKLLGRARMTGTHVSIALQCRELSDGRNRLTGRSTRERGSAPLHTKKISTPLGCSLNLLACSHHYAAWADRERAMDLRHVRFAIAVSEELQFTAAARRCGVSQPSLTVAIRALEDELGRPLFERRPEVRVTDFGQRVLAQMYVISDACDAIAAMAVATPKRLPIPDDQVEVAQSRPAG